MDKRSAVRQQRRGIRWTALALVHPRSGLTIKARTGSRDTPSRLDAQGAEPLDQAIGARSLLLGPRGLLPQALRKLD